MEARVDLGHVLETAKSTDLHVGEWLVVTGYVDRVREKVVSSSSSSGSNDNNINNRDTSSKKGGRGRRRHVAHVQAVMLASAGAVNLDRYQKALERLRRSEDAMSKGKDT